jgi:hypothetical protein
MRLRYLLSVLVLASSLPCAFADEGMWLYNAFPKDKVEKAYGFHITQEWLDHLRLSSVRFNNGGSGSFVSADGLAFTNHHVGANCIQKLSTSGADYMKTGFYAKTRAEEVKCPDLELNVLVAIEDVTARVENAASPSMSAADAAQAQRAAMSTIEKDCASATGLRCDVITLYSGEVYNLYKYKKYTDVRLVFSPEFQIAFFGGDPDNFTFPRYDLDITFFRIYENDKPVHLEHYLRWSKSGVQENDLIFVSGHPGGTDRLRTMAQVQFLRDVDYPTRLTGYKRRIDDLQSFSALSAENERIAREEMFSFQNSQKAIIGYLEGARNEAAMAARSKAERNQQAQYAAQHPGQPSPWDEISRAVQTERSIYDQLTYVERYRGFLSDLAVVARHLVRAADEKPKANAVRLREYRDSNLASLEQGIFSTAPVYKNLETTLLASSFALMQQALGNDDPAVQAALHGKSPAEAAQELIAGTRLDDVAFRHQLYTGGKAAIDASTDPLIILMRNIDAEARAVRKRYEDEVDAVERRDGAAIVRAQFAQTGFNQPPDATFTLRLSYGPVKGYAENGKHIPYFTTLGGAFEHAEAHGSKSPYELPESWLKARAGLNLKTPFNFVSTADIIGGNSGSPTINRAGEVVGIIFDGNIQSLVLHFYYDDTLSRAVSVDSRGIVESLRKIYGADPLANELLGEKN